MIEPQKKVGPKINDTTAAAVRKAIADVHDGNMQRALIALARYYAVRTEKLPPEGISYYGLCLAKLQNEHRRGLELCRESISLHPYYGQSYINLARIYLMLGDRRRAISAIDLGLKNNPGHAGILKFRTAIGYRQRPVIPFLSRDHALNVTLGRMRARKRRTGART